MSLAKLRTMAAPIALCMAGAGSMLGSVIATQPQSSRTAGVAFVMAVPFSSGGQ